MKRPRLPDLGLVTADVLDAVSLERIQLKNKLRKNYSDNVISFSLVFYIVLHSTNYSIITEKLKKKMVFVFVLPNLLVAPFP
jgi:hypothetical protein